MQRTLGGVREEFSHLRSLHDRIRYARDRAVLPAGRPLDDLAGVAAAAHADVRIGEQLLAQGEEDARNATTPADCYRVREEAKGLIESLVARRRSLGGQWKLVTDAVEAAHDIDLRTLSGDVDRIHRRRRSIEDEIAFDRFDPDWCSHDEARASSDPAILRAAADHDRALVAARDWVAATPSDPQDASAYLDGDQPLRTLQHARQQYATAVRSLQKRIAEEVFLDGRGMYDRLVATGLAERDTLDALYVDLVRLRPSPVRSSLDRARMVVCEMHRIAVRQSLSQTRARDEDLTTQLHGRRTTA